MAEMIVTKKQLWAGGGMVSVAGFIMAFSTIVPFYNAPSIAAEAKKVAMANTEEIQSLQQTSIQIQSDIEYLKRDTGKIQEEQQTQRAILNDIYRVVQLNARTAP